MVVNCPGQKGWDDEDREERESRLTSPDLVDHVSPTSAVLAVPPLVAPIRISPTAIPRLWNLVVCQSSNSEHIEI